MCRPPQERRGGETNDDLLLRASQPQVEVRWLLSLEVPLVAAPDPGSALELKLQPVAGVDRVACQVVAKSAGLADQVEAGTFGDGHGRLQQFFLRW